MATKSRYVSVSIPKAIAEAIDELMEKLGYWPSRGAFVREATLAKIREERRRLGMKPQVVETPRKDMEGEG